MTAAPAKDEAVPAARRRRAAIGATGAVDGAGREVDALARSETRPDGVGEPVTAFGWV